MMKNPLGKYVRARIVGLDIPIEGVCISKNRKTIIVKDLNNDETLCESNPIVFDDKYLNPVEMKFAKKLRKNIEGLAERMSE